MLKLTDKTEKCGERKGSQGVRNRDVDQIWRQYEIQQLKTNVLLSETDTQAD